MYGLGFNRQSGQGIFSLPQPVQTGPRAHPASCSRYRALPGMKQHGVDPLPSRHVMLLYVKRYLVTVGKYVPLKLLLECDHISCY